MTNMKAVTLCIIFVAATWARSLDSLQQKRLYVHPLVDKIPSDLIPRITNGEEAAPHSIPYQAYLLITDRSNQRWLCGGSLISPQHVLTAGHCVDDGLSAQVYLGAHNIRESESSRIVVESRTLIRHEGYNADTISNDIGVIVLDEPVELNEYIGVAQLPSRQTSDTYEGDDARVSGWGLTSGNGSTSAVLMEVNAIVMNNNQCNQVYGIVLDSQICTAGTGGVGSCNGDSGGPLVTDNIQIGIVSYGEEYCSPGYPSGYTRITSFLGWLETNTGLRFD